MLADTDLVFFDPDNGIEVASVRPGRKNSSKYVYLDEIAAFYASGKSVLVYQHFPRVEREAFIASCVDRLRAVAGDATVWAFRTKHVVFLLLINPRTGVTLNEAAQRAASMWDEGFIAGRVQHRPTMTAHGIPQSPAQPTTTMPAQMHEDRAPTKRSFWQQARGLLRRTGPS